MKGLALMFLVLCGHFVVAQRPTSDLYQYNYTSVAPVFSGVEGGKITFIGSTFRYRGTDAGYIGVETAIKKINSGIGFNVSAERLGPIAGTYYNLLYNYQWNIDEKNKLIVGAKLGMYEHVMDVTLFEPVDQNDPLLNASGSISSTRLMTGLGLLYKGERFFGGISADNLVHGARHHNFSMNFDPRKTLVHYFAGATFNPGSNFSTTHSIYANTMPDQWSVELNNSLLFKKRLIAGASFQIARNTDIIPKANAGVSIKDKAKIMIMLYSKARDVDKKFSGQLLLQFSL